VSMAARSVRETLRQATASTSEGDECQAVREVDERPRCCLFARTAGLRDCGGVEVLAVDVVPLGSRTCLRVESTHMGVMPGVDCLALPCCRRFLWHAACRVRLESTHVIRLADCHPDTPAV